MSTLTDATPATSGGGAAAPQAGIRVDFETSPDRYRHWQLATDGPVATLTLRVRGPGRPACPATS